MLPRLLGRRAIALALAATLASAAAGTMPEHPFLAYHASWHEPAATRPEATTIARLPGYVNVVILAFARPDLVYPGGLDLAGTGLQYRIAGPVLRDAIALLRRRQPATRILVAVGGSSYLRWDALDEAAVARLVRDLGADGVDVDHEPTDPACVAGTGGRIACRSDAGWIAAVERLRAALPRPFLLTVPGWSVGAYGEGRWKDARPHSPWTGSMLGLLRSPAAAHIDHVSIMSYDAGLAYDAAEAFRAYRYHWPGSLALGVQVAFDDARVPRHTLDTARRFARIAAADPAGAMMLYALQIVPPGPVGPDNPGYRLLAAAICDILAIASCDRLPP